MKKLRFFKCNHCGNVVVRVVDKGVPVFCCGEKMEEIFANTTEAATEKHLPVVSINKGLLNVKVGEVMHPMLAEHYINFVVAEFDKGYTLVTLEPNSPAEATIYTRNKKVVAVYEYCNLHGLWEVEL